ncbi:MAG: ANTAR domain-containing protein [Hyphomicrobiales bacterium]|nr:ANTAR domain-containing protein [Hyphomicrobiales bacterium]
MDDRIGNVVVIDRDIERGALIEEGLREAGLRDVTLITDGNNLLNRILAIDPDVILIDLENPRRDTVEQMLRVSQQVKRPVVMFADESEPELIRKAIKAGVSAYIVDGLQKSRLKSILEVAVARFEQFHAVEAEVERLQTALEDRKTIERAKGILMETRQLSEKEAYALLRRAAMNEKKKLSEIAELVIGASRIG